jgi:hypothetical protein
MEFVDLYFHISCTGVDDGITKKEIIFTDAYHEDNFGYLMIIQDDLNRRLKLFITCMEMFSLITAFDRFVEDLNSKPFIKEFDSGSLIVQYGCLGEPFRQGVNICLYQKLPLNEFTSPDTQLTILLDRMDLKDISLSLKHSYGISSFSQKV